MARPGPLPTLASHALCLAQRQLGQPGAAAFRQGCCLLSPQVGLNLPLGLEATSEYLLIAFIVAGPSLPITRYPLVRPHLHMQHQA